MALTLISRGDTSSPGIAMQGVHVVLAVRRVRRCGEAGPAHGG